MTTALEGGKGSASRPGRSLPPGNTRYPLYRRLGEPQGRSGQVRKISPPPGFDPRTVQPVASRYTYYATRDTLTNSTNSNNGSSVFFCATAPQWARASSFTRFLDHTQRRTTVGRTSLDECVKSRPHRDSIPTLSSL